MDKKTIGQIAHEAFAAIRPGTAKPWHDLNASSQNDYEIMASAVWNEAVEACMKQVKEYGDGQNSSLEEAEADGKEGATLCFTGAVMAAGAMMDRLRSLKLSDKDSGNG